MQNFFNSIFGNNKPKHYNLSLNTAYYHAVWQDGKSIKIGEKSYSTGVIHLDNIGSMEIATLAEALKNYGKLHPSSDGFAPQFAALVYDVTAKIQCMQSYFPVTASQPGRGSFFQAAEFILNHANFRLSIRGSSGTDLTNTAPPSIRMLVAGHIAEILFKRPELLEQFFKNPRFFNVYMTAKAYTDAGGVAGGCYDPSSQSIKLKASRLYEGFYGMIPGVAPFIHEFGHMLDSFDINSSDMRTSTGLLPGMHRSDFDLYSHEARELFLSGKRLELERYDKVRKNQSVPQNEFPIGSPYVFQNDGEFIAGYLEMFFRNPNYFHQLNPTLYRAFEITFNQDPRKYWTYDFDFYIQENRTIYLSPNSNIPGSGFKVLS